MRPTRAAMVLYNDVADRSGFLASKSFVINGGDFMTFPFVVSLSNHERI